jgi:hypothetical protein
VLGIDIRSTRQNEAVEVFDHFLGVGVASEFYWQASREGDGSWIVREVKIELDATHRGRHVCTQRAGGPATPGDTDKRTSHMSIVRALREL